MYTDYRQQPPMGMQQHPMGTFHQQPTGQHGPGSQFFPGMPGFPGGSTERRLSQLERQMERVERQIERLDRRVSRIERQLGFTRPEYYDLPDHQEYY